MGWDKGRAPMVNGGLGIWKITSFNKALLGKWLWQFGMDETRLWRHVIALKFGEELGGWTSQMYRGPNNYIIYRKHTIRGFILNQFSELTHH